MQNRPTRPRRLAAQIQETTGPAAAPETHVAKTPGPAAPRQTSEFIGSVLGMFAVTMCIFVMFVIVMVFGFTLNSRNIEKTHAYLAELREAAETSFESLNKIAQFVDYSESRPPAVAGFPVVIPAERMTENSPEIVLLPNATAYCRADLTHCIFDNIDAERLPKRYTVTADKDTGLHRLDIAAYRNSWTGVDIFLFVMMPIAVVFYTICDGIRQCIQISIESTKLSDTALTKHKAELADSPPSEIPVAARPGELTRCFAAAVAGTYAFGDFGDFRLVCGPDGLWLMGKTWCCDYMRYMHFVKAERAELIPGARVVDGTMSDAFCGSADTIYKLTPELSITSFGGGDYCDRPDGMPRISLLGVVYDGVEIPPE